MLFRNKRRSETRSFDISTVKPTKAKLLPFVTEGSVAALPSIIVGTAGALWFLHWILSLPIWKPTLGAATIVSLVFLPVGIVWSEFRRRHQRSLNINPPPVAWYKTAIGNALATLAVLVLVFWYDTTGIRTTLFYGLGAQALSIPFLIWLHYRRLRRHHEGRHIIALMAIVFVGIALMIAAHFTIRELPGSEGHATQPTVTQTDQSSQWKDRLMVGGLVVGGGLLLLGFRKRKK
ncbi:MAG: hypothetical protein K0S68_1051 [Candidatus Saccharibacteria bacterium]|nr:hypothetical protein [Candidatus Saccharibacteria bacterium]